MSRNPEKARALPGFAGVSVIAGDPAEPQSLLAAFAGVERAFLILPGGPTWNISERNVIDAARQAGVKHVVKLSVLGVDPNAPSMCLTYHLQGEQYLAESGIPFTVLRPGSFMQNFSVFYSSTIRSDGVFYQCTGDAPLSLIDTRDIAEVAATVLTAPIEKYQGKIYELTGPEAITYTQAAQKLSTATGRTVRYQDLPPEVFEQALKAQLPEWAAGEFVNIYGRGPYRKGIGGRVSSAVEEILGRRARSFDEFARDYAAAFQP